MNKVVKKAIFALPLFSILAIVPAMAQSSGGEFDGVTITRVRTDRSGVVVIDFSAGTQFGTPPACATVTNRLTADANTAGGKAILATALVAYISGKPVFVQGTGQCSEVPGVLESISLLQAK